MKIIDNLKKEKTVKLEDVDAYDLFEYDNTVFMKLPKDPINKMSNVYRFGGRGTYVFSEGLRVTLLDFDIVVRGTRSDLSKAYFPNVIDDTRTKLENRYRSFDYINEYSVFEYEGKKYMKIPEFGGCNVRDLNDACNTRIGKDSQVLPLDVSLVINDYK